jgi:hypothetical protein
MDYTTFCRQKFAVCHQASACTELETGSCSDLVSICWSGPKSLIGIGYVTCIEEKDNFKAYGGEIGCKFDLTG